MRKGLVINSTNDVSPRRCHGMIKNLSVNGLERVQPNDHVHYKRNHGDGNKIDQLNLTSVAEKKAQVMLMVKIRLITAQWLSVGGGGLKCTAKWCGIPTTSGIPENKMQN